jgi:hypothetical protein
MPAFRSTYEIIEGAVKCLCECSELQGNFIRKRDRRLVVFGRALFNLGVRGACYLIPGGQEAVEEMPQYQPTFWPCSSVPDRKYTYAREARISNISNILLIAVQESQLSGMMKSLLVWTHGFVLEYYVPFYRLVCESEREHRTPLKYMHGPDEVCRLHKIWA